MQYNTRYLKGLTKTGKEKHELSLQVLLYLCILSVNSNIKKSP